MSTSYAFKKDVANLVVWAMVPGLCLGLLVLATMVVLDIALIALMLLAMARLAALSCSTVRAVGVYRQSSRLHRQIMGESKAR